MNTRELEQNLIERVTMGDMLRRRARDSGDKLALVDFPGGQRREMSYTQLNQRVNKLAHGLVAKGLQQGEKLALVSSNQSDMLVVYFACYKLGIIIVPINFMQAADDMRYNLEHSEAVAIFYEDILADLITPCLAGNDAIRLSVQLGATAGKADTSLEALLTDQSDTEIEDRIIKDRDTAHMIYTSGTTSRPKAVETSHLSLTIAALTAAVELDTRKGSAHLLILPLFHCAALSLTFPTLLRSGTLVLHGSFEPQKVIDSIEQDKIETALLLPMMWHALLSLPGIEKRDLSSFQIGIYAMAPMDANSLNRVRQVFGCEMHLGSGQTEFAPSACLFRDQSPTQFGEGNYWGKAVCTVDQAIIDDHGIEVPQGEIGEIVWRGAQAMSGYYKNPEASAEASKFGWHHTGDLGLIDDQGQLLFVDRKKDTIKSGGENVSSMKVEQALLSFEGVIQAAAFGLAHPRWGEAVCGCVIATPGTQLNEEALIAHCKQHLGRFETPKRVIISDALPLTGTGKVRKVELRQQYKDLFADEPA